MLSFIKILTFVLKKDSRTGVERREGVNKLEITHMLSFVRARHMFTLNLMTQLANV